MTLAYNKAITSMGIVTYLTVGHQYGGRGEGGAGWNTEAASTSGGTDRRLAG